MRPIGKEAKNPQNRMEEPAVPVRRKKNHKINKMLDSLFVNIQSMKIL